MLPELWYCIIEFLDCDDICCLHLTNKYLNNLCKTNDSYIKRKMRGFPRPTGHCGNHEVFVDFVVQFYNGSHSREEKIALFDRTLNRLKAIKADLVRGDLILYPGHRRFTCHGLKIYDGHKIIDFDYRYEECGCLPSKFKIINDNVPIHYWYQNRKLDNIGWSLDIGPRGVHLNDLVWFDHSAVKQQCIDNIVNKKGKIRTTFVYNNQKYILDYYELNNVERFKYCLNRERLLLCVSKNKNRLKISYYQGNI